MKLQNSNYMKKILLTSLIIAFTGVVNAQLFVKDGSYVFMTNQYMTVTQDVNLNNTGNLYLRNTSQLLQKGTGASLNTGTGKLSVFQEGTVNNFQYNYWCSPVGSGAAGNPFGVALLNRPTGLVSSTAAEILPTNSHNGTATGGAGSTMQIAPYWIWKFVSLSPVYANWQYVGNAQTLNPGEGFSMKGTSGTDALAVDADGVANKTGSAQRYDFRGRPNDGNISVAVSNGNLTLVGNPYSSAINLNMYLVENRGDSYNVGTGAVSAGGNTAVINGTAYYWEHSKSANTHILSGYVGGYGTYVANGANVATPGTWVAATWNTYTGSGALNSTGASSGSTFKRQFSPIGQGFMVQGVAAGNSVMKNAYRVFVKEGVANNSTFEKTSNSTESSDGVNWDEIPNVAGIDYTQLSKLPVPQIKLEAILNNTKSVEIAMAFNPNTTDNYDLGYDGISSDVYVNAPDMIYFGLNNNDKKCVITTLPFNIDKRIPIAFKSAAPSNFRVKVSDIINFTEAENVYIHDKETGIYFDIKNSEFNMSLPAGENASRFEVTFKNFDALLSNDNNNIAANSFEVFQNNKSAMLTIVNTLGKEIANCSIYDVTGKLVITKKNLGKNTQIELPTNALSDGVYIVKLNTADNISVEKKVIVKN